MQPGNLKPSDISQRQRNALHNISLSGCFGGFLCWSGREDWASWLVFGTARVFAKHDVCQEQAGTHAIVMSSPSTSCGITGVLLSVRLLQVMDQSPRIIEYLKLEGTRKDHQVRLPAPRRTT